MRVLLLLLVTACGSDLRTHTQAFVATTPCGQGPYDVHLVADGKTGEEGVEIVACTAHRLTGHVEVIANQIPLTTHAFGDAPDNARCLAGNGTVVVTRDGTSGAAARDGAAPGARGATPTLVERPYNGSETPFTDELCRPFGLQAQTLLIPTTTTTELLRPGSDLHVRIWSDAPNDLEGAVFLIRHVTSTKSLAEVKREDAKWEREHAHDKVEAPPPRRVADHGPPPAPLAEERPSRPTAAATWIAGYWTWTGTSWGWIAGFWRDERVAMPAPQVELPGAPPAPTAVWIGGSWQLRAGSWIWIRGRWR